MFDATYRVKETSRMIGYMATSIWIRRPNAVAWEDPPASGIGTSLKHLVQRSTLLDRHATKADPSSHHIAAVTRVSPQHHDVESHSPRWQKVMGDACQEAD